MKSLMNSQQEKLESGDVTLVGSDTSTSIPQKNLSYSCKDRVYHLRGRKGQQFTISDFEESHELLSLESGDVTLAGTDSSTGIPQMRIAA